MADFKSTLTVLGYTVWTAGNMGSGSGLNADLVDGYNTSIASSASTLVVRDSSSGVSCAIATLTSVAYSNLSGASIAPGSGGTSGYLVLNGGGTNGLYFSTNVLSVGLVTLQNAISATGSEQYGMALRPTYSQSSGSSTNIDLLIDRNTTGGITSGSQYFINARINGSAVWTVQTNGNTTLPSTATLTAGTISVVNTLTTTTVSGTTMTLSGVSGSTTFVASKPSNESNNSNLNYTLQILPVYTTQSGTTGATDLYILRSETAIGSGEHNLIRADVLSSAVTNTRFRVSNKGVQTITSGYFSADGDVRHTTYILFRNTTAASATELTLGGGTPATSNRVAILASRSYACTVTIHGKVASGGTYWMMMRQFIISTNGSAVGSLVGSIQTVGVDYMPSTITFTADVGTTGILGIKVTPANTTSTNWVAKLEMLELT